MNCRGPPAEGAAALRTITDTKADNWRIMGVTGLDYPGPCRLVIRY